MARPRANDYDQKRQAILDRAAILFAQKGFAGTSIASIAKFCDSSKALLYHYYQSKESLLFDMLNSHCRLLVAIADEALNFKGDPEAKLRQLARSLMGVYVHSRDKHVVLLNDLHWLNPAQQKRIKELERKVVQSFKDLVAMVHPELPENLRTAAAMSLLGSINWTYTWFKPDGALSPPEFSELAATLFLRGLLEL